VGTRVHVVGVAGAGMSAVARLLVERGCVVSGSDEAEGPVVASLRAAGVEVDQGADPAHGASTDVVLYSPAVASDHPELAAARARGAAVLARPALLAALAQLAPVVGVTGTHGKTTASSMLAQILSADGRDPAWLVGAEIRDLGAGGHWGAGELVMEVDESYGAFAELAPAALGLLNVEADHLDFYGDLDALEAAFAALVERTSGPVVVWVDDEGAARVVARARRAVTTVGRAEATWRVVDERRGRTGSTFALAGASATVAIELGVLGAHNVADAAVAAALALEWGASLRAVAEGLARFRGAPRRLERRGYLAGADLFEDYAHLPGEVAATLEALADAGYETVVALFQPHRVTRTAALAESFAPAFDRAAAVVVTDIYRAGEPNPEGLTGEVVATALRARRGEVAYVADLAGAGEALAAAVARTGARAAVVLGAGDVARALSGVESP
jgi:UDP-N-acetylmuramate--alanine ligase